MKPFDLEAAKRGEQVCYPSGSPVHFIGVSSTEHPVVEDSQGFFTVCSQNQLRMAPKKVTVRYRVGAWKDKGGIVHPLIVEDVDAQDGAEIGSQFLYWISGWQTAEIQGGE